MYKYPTKEKENISPNKGVIYISVIQIRFCLHASLEYMYTYGKLPTQ